MTAATSPPSTALARPSLDAAIVELDPNAATELRAAFEQMFAQAEDWTARAKLIQVTSVEQKRDMRLARETRLALREIRVKAEHARKKLKEDSQRRGKAIDGIANVLKALIEPIEEHLLEQETFAERAEAKRKSDLKAAREEALRAYGANVEAFANLGETSEETWATILDEAKLAHEARVEAAKQAELVRVEAERIAAEKRKAEREEAARLEAERVEREKAQAEENARLKAEAEAQRAQAAADLAAAEAKARAEREELEAKARADREAAEAEARQAKEVAAKAQAELEAAQKLEAIRKGAEERRIAEEAAAAERASTAPDREKLLAFAAALKAIPVPDLTSEKGKSGRGKIVDQVAKLIAWIEKAGEAL